MVPRSRLTTLAAGAARRVPPVGRLVAERDQWRRQARAQERRLERVTDKLRAAREEAAAARREADKFRFEAAAATNARAALREAVGAWLPGHYYSPIPDLDQVRARDEEIFAIPPSVVGIDFRPEAMLARLEEFAGFYAEQPFGEEPQGDLRYGLKNRFFAWSDGIALYCMLRSLRPRRFVEVGSGWSSALALDVTEKFLDGSMECTFIEPYAERLHSLLRPEDESRTTILEQPLYEVDQKVFDSLESGDVLFIDSTHVSKIGSDVNRLVLEVLPRLPTGVHVHVHDIFYPFEYPRDWVYDGRAWTEAYLLRAYLTDNPTIRITWSNSYLKTFHAEEVTAAMPLWGPGHGGSLWLETLDCPERRNPR